MTKNKRPLHKTCRDTKSKNASEIMDHLIPEQGLQILQQLAVEDKSLAKKVCDRALELLGDVDTDDLSAEVQSHLELLDVEDVWAQSGSTRDGYVDSGEAAYQMFENQIEPFNAQMKKFMELGMRDWAKRQCMGLLKGIWLFHEDSCTEFQDWAVDAPGEYFDSILSEWWKMSRNKTELKDVLAFVKTQCPEWLSPELEADLVRK